jgi:hypothetical protein
VKKKCPFQGRQDPALEETIKSLTENIHDPFEGFLSIDRARSSHAE